MSSILTRLSQETSVAGKRNNDTMIESAWIRARLTRLGKTQVALASFVGIAEDKVNKVIQGDRKVQPQEMPKFASFLALPLEKFSEAYLSGSDPDPDSASLESASPENDHLSRTDIMRLARSVAHDAVEALDLQPVPERNELEEKITTMGYELASDLVAAGAAAAEVRRTLPSAARRAAEVFSEALQRSL